MKRANLFNLLLIILALTLVSTGCRKKPYGVTQLPGQRTGAPSGPPPGGMLTPGIGPDYAATSSGIPTADPTDLLGRPEDRSILQAHTVYFDFDSSAINTSEVSKIEAVASYLKSSPANALKIEGHCDERGTDEYNRALGERRAQAVREFLVSNFGINPGIILTVSYGEESPAVDGQTEEAYAKNRRGEFVVLLPK